MHFLIRKNEDLPVDPVAGKPLTYFNWEESVKRTVYGLANTLTEYLWFICGLQVETIIIWPLRKIVTLSLRSLRPYRNLAQISKRLKSRKSCKIAGLVSRLSIHLTKSSIWQLLMMSLKKNARSVNLHATSSLLIGKRFCVIVPVFENKSYLRCLFHIYRFGSLN
jgi:hypothetical protein